MKSWQKPSKIEWISLAVMAPVYALLLNNLLFGYRNFTDYKPWLFSFPIILVLISAAWYLQVSVMHWLRAALPDISQTRVRLLLLGFTHIMIIASAIVVLYITYGRTHFLGYEIRRGSLRFPVFVGVGLTMVTTSMWEAGYSLSKLKQSLLAKDQLEHLTLQHEFNTLKNQVNPHFLFNCFNTLSSLISEDRKQAEIFLDELSKVYRYLLKNNEEGLASLQTEIRFIESYYRLLKTRHGESVQLNIETDKRYDNYLLPPLSLQMLVENAVKHNVLSRSKPLTIDIFTTSGNKLVISNNLQVRTVKGPSNRIGLDNIKAKYDLLHTTGFQVLQDKKTFSVVLPLIWNKAINQKLITIESI